MNTVDCIINGNVLGKLRLQHQLEKVLGTDYQVIFHATTARNHGIEIARELTTSGSRILVAIGGDGTINEVVNGIMQAPAGQRQQLLLGILPKGTGNDFARGLKLNQDMERLCRLIKARTFIPADVGQLFFTNKKGHESSRYFMNITDIGVGGVAVEMVNKSNKLLGANFTFLKSVVVAFFKYKHQKVRLKSDKLQWEGEIMSLSIANGRFFGSGLCIAPNASVSDGQFDITVVGKVKVTDFIKKLPGLRSCRKIQHTKVLYSKSTHCRVETDEKNCPIDMDGDFIGYAPLEAKLLHHQLKIIAPNT